MGIEVVKLWTEYAENPLGIDTRQPRLSWRLASSEPSQRQTAYRVIVSSSPEKLDCNEEDQWDSGRVESGDSIHVYYAGETLQSGKQYWWKVQVWDKEGSPSPWSKPSFWSMGPLKPEDWSAQWIGMNVPHSDDYPPAAYLRKSFTLDKPVKRAVIYSTALGLYELYLGGRRVGNDEFAPGWTDYNIRIQYQAYDVTDTIQQGTNVLGAILGTGWYSGKLAMVGKRKYGYCPYLLVQLQIEFTDGSEQTVITDAAWKTSEGPLEYSEIFRGERYDARKELNGWQNPDYDDSGWNEPIRLPYSGDRYGGKLVAQVDPAVRTTREIKPISVWKTEAGTYIFDMGQNMAGRVRLKVRGERGRQVKLDHAEFLEEDGRLYKTNLRTATPVDIYILKGEGTEWYEPKFTFHGFRYVEVSGLPEEPDLDTITGRVIHTDAPFTGRIETSHPLVNQLQSNIVWGQIGNFLSVPTDCPQRDERLGWTGDAQVFCRTACFNMEGARFFGKYSIDMADAQLDSGSFPDVAPNCGYHARKVIKARGHEWNRPYSAGWADAGIIIPWMIYQMYGDRYILERHYASMISYMGYLNGMSDNFLMPQTRTNNYGDWLSVGADTPKHLISTAYFAYSTELMARIAAVLGKNEDAERYRERAEQIRKAFKERYVTPDGKIEGDTQTAYAIALYMELLPEPLAKLAASHLAADVRRRGNHLSTGFIGTGYLLPALSAYGFTDVAYDLLLQETYPSWLNQIHNGATTMWERWDGYLKEKGIHPDRMNSFNHYAYGAVGEWMFRFMAGIDTDPERPGFKHIHFRPKPGMGIHRVEAEYESMYGIIRSSWHVEEGTFYLNVTVPVNTTATITLPSPSAEAYEVGAGEHEYIVKLDLEGNT